MANSQQSQNYIKELRMFYTITNQPPLLTDGFGRIHAYMQAKNGVEMRVGGGFGAAASAERWRKALERIHTASIEVDLKQFKAPNGPALIPNPSGLMSAKAAASLLHQADLLMICMKLRNILLV